MADGSGDKTLEVKECDNFFTSFLSASHCVSQGLDRFPLLIWKRILENCWTWDYPEMLEFFIVVRLPGHFLSYLEMDSVRNNVVFHVLFPTLTSNYVGLGSMRDPDEDDQDHASLLDFQDIHNCRLVCRAWNSAIRKNVVSHVSRVHPSCCLHEWGSDFLWPRESRNPYATHCNNAYSHFLSTSDIAKFLSHFEESHQCRRDVTPFHCHHVSFVLLSRNTSTSPELTDITVYSAPVFFTQFGKHLRRLNLSLYLTEPTFVGWLYPGVLRLFRETPNLEALRISLRSHIEFEEFWKRIAKIDRGSCPELKFLTHLEVDGIPHTLFNDIIRSNGSHIEKLKISGLEVRRHALFRKYALHRILLTNLRELRISFEYATQNDLVRLAKSAPHWTKLEKVKLDFEGDARVPKSISWHLILQCLNKFSETVTHLWVRFPTLDSQLRVGLLHDYCPTREERLKLPNLEQVVLKFPEGSACSQDFLYGLDKLETIYIQEMGGSLTLDPVYNEKFALLLEYLNTRGHQKINFVRDIMEHLEIWEHFPKLSKLYWRQGQTGKKSFWKRMNSPKRKSRAEPTAWTLRDTVEESPDFWTRFWAYMVEDSRTVANE